MDLETFKLSSEYTTEHGQIKVEMDEVEVKVEVEIKVETVEVESNVRVEGSQNVKFVKQLM